MMKDAENFSVNVITMTAYTYEVIPFTDHLNVFAWCSASIFALVQQPHMLQGHIQIMVS